jgi:regulator of replication initiation timing
MDTKHKKVVEIEESSEEEHEPTESNEEVSESVDNHTITAENAPSETLIPENQISPPESDSKEKEHKSSKVKKKESIPEPEGDLEPGENETEKISDTKLVARTLLRLYTYLEKGAVFNEDKLIRDLEFNTVNQQLREQLDAAKIEVQTLLEENQALREHALQTQVESGDYIEHLESENNDLKSRLQQIDDKVKEELEKRTTKYQDIIRDLRNQLGEALKRNEVVTEVTESIAQLQERIKTLFETNSQLEQENITLRNSLGELEEKYTKLVADHEKSEAKVTELKKKDELQVMVIAGLKRQLGEH